MKKNLREKFQDTLDRIQIGCENHYRAIDNLGITPWIEACKAIKYDDVKEIVEPLEKNVSKIEKYTNIAILNKRKSLIKYMKKKLIYFLKDRTGMIIDDDFFNHMLTNDNILNYLEDDTEIGYWKIPNSLDLVNKNVCDRLMKCLIQLKCCDNTFNLIKLSQNNRSYYF